MASIIDFHVHVFPDPMSKLSHSRFSAAIGQIFSPDKVAQLRKEARTWIKPVTGTLHHFQTVLRHFPSFTRKNLDEFWSFVPIPGLLVESTSQDLLDAMDQSQIDFALVIAHPPSISNDFVMETCAKNSRLIPVVNIPRNTPKVGLALKEYVKQGAKVLKIHPAADGEDAQSPRYKKLLKTAADLGIPVIVHTGCIHSHLFYKAPSSGNAENFSEWFETYPSISFVLAHMNFHEPGIALDLCEEYSNVYVDTSWQPAEVIGEAARRVGAERVLFGTDWPLIGNNMTVGRKRVDECIDIGLLNADQAQLILGANAMKLLGMS